jgi:23S rRNA (uracil1939-C5)-methyltransferase
MNPQIQIEKLVYGGEGLGRVDGEVVLTPFVLPGETIEAERTESRQHVQRACLVNVLEPSPDRVTPPCPVFTQCGGCQYQHANYDAQLRLKRDILAETLRRVGKIDFDPSRIVVESAAPLGYRNRVQLHLEGGRIGYRAMQSRRLIPIAQCPIASPKLDEIIARLTKLVRDRRWPNFIQQIELFTDESRIQWNVLESSRPVAKRFFDWLTEEFPGTVAGPLEYRVNEDAFRISGTSFFQVNRFLSPRLAELAIGDATGMEAWDLYAGVGLFSLPLARRFEKVVAVESGRAASADLRHNASRAGLRIEVATQNTEEFLAAAKTPPRFVLADPPRSGLGKTAAARLLALAPPALGIVSCDPATLARDLAALSTGYEIYRLTLVDLFPQTFHLETIAALRLRQDGPGHDVPDQSDVRREQS